MQRQQHLEVSASLPLSVSNQTGKLSVEAADIAASVLIKLLIDM